MFIKASALKNLGIHFLPFADAASDELPLRQLLRLSLIQISVGMAAVMLLTMKSMYRNTKLNVGLYVVFAAVFVLSLAGIRAQGFVGDRQFVRSMIPHHSGAILMCGQAPIKDAEIRELCFGPNGIIESQKREIAQMKAILKRL